MLPMEIDKLLRRDVIGQEEVLRFVSVAIYKHLAGERFGNLMMIGNSGTGKTTVMRAMERMYHEHPEFAKYRVVVILNANTFATDEGIVDTSQLFRTLEERARQILGDDAPARQVAEYMEHATVCIDEVDKVSGVIGGKPYVTGINIQQALLTMIEGEKAVLHLDEPDGDKVKDVRVTINTGKMLFLCAGAYEALYDLVFDRVTSPTSRVKLPTETVITDDGVEIREYFTLRHHFKTEDLFDYGMQPQFLSRFDNSIILEDLNSDLLQRIFLDTDDSVFRLSQEFFKQYDIDLQVTPGAVKRIADEAVKSRRIGARALKEVYGRIIKPFEYDPYGHEKVTKTNGGYQLVIDEEIVRYALRPLYERVM
jgi:ATP-dependent Clp protease ATP-binding subunit ClpX